MRVLAPGFSLDEFAAYAAIFCVTIAGNAFVALAPMFVGGMVDHWGMTESEVGTLVSYEFLGTSVATVISIFFLHRPRWPLRTTAFCALALVAIGNAITPLVHQMPWLLTPTRVMCGFCGGLTWIVSATAIAQMRNNKRALALFYGSPYLTGMVFQPALPRVFETWGVDGGYLMIATGSALCFLLYGRYLTHGRTGGAAPAAAARSTRVVAALTAVVLASFAIQNVANSGLPVYFERIGIGAGHPLQATANMLSAALAFAVAGTFLATVCADRLRPVPAILAGTLLISVASALVLKSGDVIAFLFATSLFNLVIAFVTPFYFIVLEQAGDPARNAILGNIAMTLGFSAGPMLIGMTVGDAGYLMPVIVTVTLFAVSLGLLLIYSITRNRALQATPEEAGT